ncbi:hypothetical protein CSC73_03200 [Pseudoxanthomonas sacheonensis]|nr:hypothetical protein CSC73_03200 [Pseudoxanthomonas sacheonensis]
MVHAADSAVPSSGATRHLLPMGEGFESRHLMITAAARAAKFRQQLDTEPLSHRERGGGEGTAKS